MEYRKLGTTGVEVSAIGLGGHEFGPDDFIRGFQDDGKKAVQPGFLFDGFGGENRTAIVREALDLGVNLFDLTIDSEVEAMGRVLKELRPSGELVIQTRPQGMVYGYDPENRQMARYDLLKPEVERLCGLLQRDHVDILNFAFMQAALDADPEYLEKIADNIARLKGEGLIRWASADTFSGPQTYLTQYAAGCFDTSFVNYNIIERANRETVIPAADEAGIGVLCREAFMKARLFAMAEEAGFSDRSLVARSVLQWILREERISSVMIGVADPDQLRDNCSVLEVPVAEGDAIIRAIMQTEACRSATR